MATSFNNPPDPYADQLPGGGASLVIWMIIGCAVLAGVVIIWDARNRSQIKARAARVESEVRDEFRKSLRQLRENNPRAVIARDQPIGERLDWLMQVDPDGYIRLRVARLFIRASARIMLDDRDEWLKADADFSDGLSMMRRARGQAWESGLCGRGEARFKLGNYNGALADLTAVINGNPSFGKAYYWRSKTFEALGNMAAAERDAERARALDSWPPITAFTRETE